MAQVPPTPSTGGASINTQTHQTSTQSLPAVLRGDNVKQPIEGQIVENRNDGVTSIQTRHGPIEIRLKGERPPEGTRVSIEVAPKASGQAQVKITVTKQQAPLPEAVKGGNVNVQTNGKAPAQNAAKSATQTTSGNAQIDAQKIAQQTQVQNAQANNINAIKNALPQKSLAPLEQILSQNTGQGAAQRPPVIGDVLKLITAPLITNNAAPAPQNTQQNLLSPALNNGINALFKSILQTPSTAALTPTNATINTAINALSSSPLQNLFSSNFSSATPQNAKLSPQISFAQGSLNTASNISPALLQPQSNATGQQGHTITQTLSNGALLNPAIIGSTQGQQSINVLAQNIGQSLKPQTQISLQGGHIKINAKITAIAPPLSSLNGGINNAGALQFSSPGQVTAITGEPIILNANNSASSASSNMLRIPVTLMNGDRPISGQFLLPSNIGNVPAGTRLALNISEVQNFAPNGQAISSPLSGLGGLMQALGDSDIFTDDLLKLLEVMQDKLAPESLQAAMRFLPQAASPARLTSTMMFFMAALKGGDIKQWLGERNMLSLQNTQNNLLSDKLERSFAALSRTMNDPVRVQGGEWRSFLMPMLFGPDLSRLQFHIRDYHYEGENGASEEDNKPMKRVIIEFTMSRMGQMQIDSLLMNKRLETIIRAGNDFSSAMRQDLRQRYTTIMRGIGYEGHLDFQALGGGH